MKSMRKWRTYHQVMFHFSIVLLDYPLVSRICVMHSLFDKLRQTLSILITRESNLNSNIVLVLEMSVLQYHSWEKFKMSTGAFGFVQLARNRRNGHLVAIKFLERGPDKVITNLQVKFCPICARHFLDNHKTCVEGYIWFWELNGGSKPYIAPMPFFLGFPASIWHLGLGIELSSPIQRCSAYLHA